jgi:ABC-type amino acid transport substrate-binding protein
MIKATITWSAWKKTSVPITAIYSTKQSKSTVGLKQIETITSDLDQTSARLHKVNQGRTWYHSRTWSALMPSQNAGKIDIEIGLTTGNFQERQCSLIW